MIYTQKTYTDVHAYSNLKRFEASGMTLCVDVRNDRAICLPYSPAGGLSVQQDSEIVFARELLNWESKLKHEGVKSIEITLPIAIYQTAPQQWLKKLGYEISVEEIAHYIPIEGMLSDKLHTMQQRKLAKQKAFDFKLEPHDSLEEVYQFIELSRTDLQIPLNVSFEKLKKLFTKLPDAYHIHTARLSGSLAACGITVIPTTEIVYYFLPASGQAFRNQSPMVGLIDHMYSYYQKLGFQFMDLGISSQDGVPQSSLITFKERMGGVSVKRLTFVKSFD